MRINVSNQALQEIDESYEYYFTKASKETADRFQIEVQSRIKYLENFSETGPTVKDSKRKPRNKNRRFVTLHKFPQQIYYRIDTNTNTLNIDRVLHEKRDMESLLKK